MVFSTKTPMRAVAATVLVCCVAEGGCKCGDSASTSSPAPLLSISRPDRLAPGELPPGKDVVFGLRLPSAVKVVVREPFRVQCEGRVQPETVANYLRSHIDIDAESVDIGAAKTIFKSAVVRGTKEPRLRIEVVKIDRGTRLIIQDMTPAKMEPMSKEEIWKIHGYDKEGKRIDPSKFE